MATEPSKARKALEMMERDVVGRVGPVTHWEGCASDPEHWRCACMVVLRRVLDAAEAIAEADAESSMDYDMQMRVDAMIFAMRGEG